MPYNSSLNDANISCFLNSPSPHSVCKTELLWRWIQAVKATAVVHLLHPSQKLPSLQTPQKMTWRWSHQSSSASHSRMSCFWNTRLWKKTFHRQTLTRPFFLPEYLNTGWRCWSAEYTTPGCALCILSTYHIFWRKRKEYNKFWMRRHGTSLTLKCQA